jgi:hypothetical protein
VEIQTHTPGMAEKRRLGVATRWLVAAILTVVLWLVQWKLAPAWLIRSTAGVQALLQAMPALVVAVYAVGLGSIFVIAQQVAPSYGSRSVRVLLRDMRVRLMLVTALLLGVGSLLLVGRVPGPTDTPPRALTAAAETVGEATAVFILVSALVLAALLDRYSDPAGFRQLVLESDGDLGPDSLKGKTRVFRQTLRNAARRGESRTLNEMAGGLLELLDGYILEIQRDPSLRSRRPKDDAAAAPGWFGEEVSRALVRAGEEGVRANALWRDLNRIVASLQEGIRRMVAAGLTEDAQALLRGLAELGCFVREVDSESLREWFVKPAVALAQVEASAEGGSDSEELAGVALAAWALVTMKLGHQLSAASQLAFEHGIRALGPRPPWAVGMRVALSGRLQPGWEPPLPGQDQKVRVLLRQAEASHASRYTRYEQGRWESR